MASSLPYAAPYTRTIAQPRPAVRLDSPLRRLLAASVVIVLVYTLLQLGLASIASATLLDLDRLEKANAAAEIERDTRLVQVEEIKHLSNIETRARSEDFRPITSIEFVH